MNRSSFFIKTFGRKSISAVLVSILLLTIVVTTVATSQTSDAERRRVFQQEAQEWMINGLEFYTKGSYEQALKSFQSAERFREYLSVNDRNKLSQYLRRASTAATERKRILDTYRAVSGLIKQNRLIEAKAQLDRIKDNSYLRAEEKAQVAVALNEIVNQIKAQRQPRLIEPFSPPTQVQPEKGTTATEPSKITGQQEKEEIAELYYRSMALYRTGELEKAREGFTKVIQSGSIPVPMTKTIEGYLREIDNRLAGGTQLETTVPKATTSKLVWPEVVKPRIREPLKAVKPEVVKPGFTEPLKVVQPVRLVS